MDDIIEFDNSEYRLASMQVKAIAYDVVTGITRKKINIKNGLDDTAKRDELLAKLNEINDKVVELTDDLELELEKLDDIDEELEDILRPSNVKPQQEVTQPKPAEETAVTPTNEEVTIPNPEPEPSILEVTEKPLITIPEPSSETPRPEQSVKEVNIETAPVEEPQATVSQQVENETKEEEPKPEISNVNLPDIPQVVNQPEEMPAEPTEISDDTKEEPVEQQEPKIVEVEENEPKLEENETTPKTKVFKKLVKDLSRAIMVKQSQLENLRNSRLVQEKLLAEKGLLPELGKKDKAEALKKEAEKPIKKELPDDVERKIEDLTVKASIYYNEGETDKAQELYDEIKRLTEENQ